MSTKAETIGLIADMLQRADARELDLVCRFLCAMLDGKGVQDESHMEAR